MLQTCLIGEHAEDDLRHIAASVRIPLDKIKLIYKGSLLNLQTIPRLVDDIRAFNTGQVTVCCLAFCECKKFNSSYISSFGLQTTKMPMVMAIGEALEGIHDPILWMCCVPGIN